MTHTGNPSRVIGTVIAIVALATAISSCSGTVEWRTLPDSPLSARGYAATACLEDGMVVWSGALPRSGTANEVIEGSALFDNDEWHQLPDPPLAPRMRAGAGGKAGLVMVWGGHDGIVRGDVGSDDFTYFADGAVFDRSATTWRVLPVAPLAPRADPQVLAIGDSSFLVAGGQAAPGADVDRSEQAATYNVLTNTWTPLAPPPPDSVIVDVGGLVAFSADGLHRYDAVADAWPLDVAYPAGVVPPRQVASNSGRVVGAAGSDVWIFDDSFFVLPAAPIEAVDAVDAVGWIGTDVVVWGYDARAAAVYEVADRSWRLSDAPAIVETRLGSSVCITETELIVWGGWTELQPVGLRATNSGAFMTPEVAANR